MSNRSGGILAKTKTKKKGKRMTLFTKQMTTKGMKHIVSLSLCKLPLTKRPLRVLMKSALNFEEKKHKYYSLHL